MTPSGLAIASGSTASDADGPVIRRPEAGLALPEEGLQLLLGRRRDLADEARRQDEDVGGAALGAVAMHRLAQGGGNGQGAGDRFGELQAGDHRALLAHIRGFVEAVGEQHLVEARALEAAARPLEVRVLGDGLGDELVRDLQPEVARLLVERRLGDEAAKDLRVDAEGPRPFRRDALPGLPGEPLHLVLIGVAVGVRRDADIADARDVRAHGAPEDVADAPDREAEDEKAEQHRDHGFADPAPAEFIDSPEHARPTSSPRLRR